MTENLPKPRKAVPPGTPLKPINDVPDVMAYLGCSRPTIYNLINSGELESFLIGNRRKITDRAVHEMIARKEGRAA